MSDIHQKLINKANAAVNKARGIVGNDPLYPSYHFAAPAHWMSDLNGPIYYKGTYHIFYQHNPFSAEWGNMSWGHARSEDLVHWEHLPIVLTPTPDGYDKDGVFSGSCIVHNNIPAILYTGVYPEVQCLAYSYDDMNTWTKHDAKPVIPHPPQKDLIGFRDPFVWKEEENWYMLVGSGIRNVGGTAFLYSSQDLIHWTYLNPLCTGFGTMWECPNFFQLGNKYVLIVSPEDEVKYAIGDYINHRFYPESWHRLDLGGTEAFYAPNTLLDPQGRRLLWGWVQGGGTSGYPWSGQLTLPRILSLRSDGKLEQKPVPELQALRGKSFSHRNITVKQVSEYPLQTIPGGGLELIMEFDPVTADSLAIRFDNGGNYNHDFSILYDHFNQQIIAGDRKAGFKLLDTESHITLHIFLDKTVYEIYANYRVCFTGRFKPMEKENYNIFLLANGSDITIRSLDIWKLESV
ncbi:MAG: glycoside hydrolase family 32 protein [Candidatus Neomarinimicrobiota bacterium]